MIWDRPELLALRDGPLVAYDAPAPTLTAGGSRFHFDGVAVELAVPGAHNARNAAAALTRRGARRRRAGDAAARASRRSAAAARRFERLGRSASGAEIYDDYAHHPTEVAATLAAARTLEPSAADRGLPAAPLFAHAGAGPRVRRGARGGRRGRRRSTSTRRASGPRTFPASAGCWSPRRRSTPPPGKPTYWLPERGIGRSRRWRALARPGDARDRDGRRRRRCARRASWWRGGGTMVEPEPDYPLARLTTVRTGGAAERFARRRLAGASSSSCSRGRASSELEVQPVGSGSNLLVADAGVRGLVLKLERELARIERDGAGPALRRRRAAAGGRGARRGARAGAGSSSPSTSRARVGGAVRMNANAYDGALAAVLDWVEIVTADGVERRGARASSASPTAARRSAPSEIVARARFALDDRGPRDRSARRSRRCASAATRRSRRGSGRSARPSRTRPGQTAGQLLAAAGVARARGRRCPLLAQARELRREHRRCEHRRDPRADGGRARAGARALRDRARARGPAPRRRSLPLVGDCAPSAKHASMRARLELPASHVRRVQASMTGCPACGRSWPGSRMPAPASAAGCARGPAPRGSPARGGPRARSSAAGWYCATARCSRSTR